MTGRPAPGAPRTAGRAATPGPWPPLALPGLYIDLGDWHRKGRFWVREPYAELRCAAGCEHYAHGADAVERFLEDLDELDHPGPLDDEQES
ncbi:hypothetical protein ACWEFL_15895 [Streptomyces sp. NPDC004838]